MKKKERQRLPFEQGRRRVSERVAGARMIQRGDRVRVSAHGQEKVIATVTLASANGRSLMLEFPGGLFGLVDAGAYIGAMPVLQQDDGRWIELINQREIQIEPVTA